MRDSSSLAGSDPFLQELFERMPREVAGSFTQAQIAALKMIYGARSRGAHLVDLRLSLPWWPGRRSYIVFLLGSERRSAERRRNDRGRMPLLTLGNAIFAVLFFGMIILAGLVVAYLVKSALGIDLVPGTSLGLYDGFLSQWRMLTR